MDQHTMKRMFLCALIAIGVGCSPSAVPQILSDSTCDLPCWNEIRMGKTSQDELLAELATLTFVDQQSITVTNAPWTIFENGVYFSLYPRKSFWTSSSRSRADGQASILSGKVVELSLCGEFGITFGQVEEEIGQPISVISFKNPFTGGIWINAFNEHVGAELWFDTTNSPSQLEGQLSRDTPIDCLVLFDPEVFLAMQDAGLFTGGHYDADETREIMYPWVGYGLINELYPPRTPSSE